VVRHPIRWLRDRPPAALDALLALALGTVSLIGLFTLDTELADSSNRDADVVGVLLTVGIWSAVAFRRRWPEAMAWTVTALLMPFWVLDYVDAGQTLGILFLLYTLAAHVDRPRSLQVGLAIGGILVAVMVAGVLSEEEGLPAIAVVGNAVIFATAWTIGDSVRNRSAYLAEVEARAERAEREQATAAERAVQDERVRIARELHDVVAHSVSVMVVQAGAARRVLERQPDQAAEALGVIESTGRNALDELRRLLGVLRHEDGSPSIGPQPTTGDLRALVEQWSEAGMDVVLEETGDRPALSAGVGLTVYRIVQEALTNVMKHAGPARAHVAVRYDDAVHIEVTDDGRGARPDVPSSGQGHIGMRERVELFGGTLSVGPRPGGGYRVRATIPLTRSAVA
jgi:signal transduction histidine kinase